MGKLIEGRFPGIKKEEKEKKEAGEKPGHGMSEQNRAIDSVSTERILFIINLQKNNPVNKSSDVYVKAFSEFHKMPIADVAKYIKDASETDIIKWPKRFVAALDVLLEK